MLLAARFDDNRTKITEFIGQDVDNPLRGLLMGKRQIYKRLVTLAKAPEGEDSDLYEAIAAARLEDLETFRTSIIKIIENQCNIKIKNSDVLIDVPLKRRERLRGRALVYLDKEPFRGRDLMGEVSPLLRQIREEFDQHSKKCRIFVSPHVYNVIDSKDKLVNLQVEVRSLLKSILGG